MQGQKCQFVRKPQKRIFSKDKPLALNSFRQLNRQKSKQHTESAIESDVSPSKPHNLIANLRSELGNLKQEVAKLSKKQNRQKSPNQHKSELHQRTEKQKKNVSQYYFDDVKSPRAIDEQKKVQKISNFDDQNLQVQLNILKNQNSFLKQQMSSYSQRQRHLEEQKQEMSRKIEELKQKYKKQFEAKLSQIEYQRQKFQRAQTNEEVDKTVTFQNQLNKNKEIIESMERTIKQINQTNRQLNIKLEIALKQNQGLERLKIDLQKKDHQIGKFLASQNAFREESSRKMHALAKDIKSKQDMIAKDSQQLQRLRQIQVKLLNKLHSIEKLNQQVQKSLQDKILDLQKRNFDLQKFIQSYSNRGQAQYQGSKFNNHPDLQIKQLRELTRIQQKSLINQQSDINYLQSELKKLSQYKALSKQQAIILEVQNQNNIKIQMQKLNLKYQNFK